MCVSVFACGPSFSCSLLNLSCHINPWLLNSSGGPFFKSRLLSQTHIQKPTKKTTTLLLGGSTVHTVTFQPSLDISGPATLSGAKGGLKWNNKYPQCGSLMHARPPWPLSGPSKPGRKSQRGAGSGRMWEREGRTLLRWPRKCLEKAGDHMIVSARPGGSAVANRKKRSHGWSGVSQA